MKLNTRVLLLVAPVILLSAAVSSYSIYFSQKEALLKREDSYLQLSMEKLAGHFRQSVTLLNSYAITLTKSDMIRYYMGQSTNPYREMKLIENLQATIENLQPNQLDDVSVAIVDNKDRVQFYADNQSDPFSTIDQHVLNYVSSTYKSTGETSHTGFTKNYQGQSILIRYDVVDQDTLGSPLSYNKDEVFLVIVSLSLSNFQQLKRILEFENDSSIFFSPIPIIKPGLTHSVELKPGLFATLDPAPYLTKQKLAQIEQRLMLSFGISSIGTMTLLLILLYRQVIQPITYLDRQLKEVEHNKRNNIKKIDNDSEIGRLSERFYDMYRELNLSYQKTKTMAENDHLTQLANRYQFQTHVEAILEEGAIESSAWILYIDLDNFKYVNDRYGHQVGDSLLVHFAEQIRKISTEYSELQQCDILASRLSGDEFAIFVQAARTKFYVDSLAKAILEPIQSSSHTLLSSFPITASIGIASYPNDGKTLEKLLSNADTAMYQAKRAGKNQIAQYSKELDDIVRRQNQIETALRNGDLEKEFTLLYQPYYDAKGLKVQGLEALLRWNSPKLGKVTPSEFIPISEQIGLFGTIDRWVIKRAFSEFHQLQSCFKHEVKLSINLSSAELDSLQLAHDIQSLARHYSVEVALIDFEITETFASDSQSFLLLHKLAHMGFNLTIDDFGSGYTSIAQLVEYPVQKIKFDREFLETLIKTNNQQVVKPLVDLCHSQSMMVTAEGIESREMHDWLAENKCDYMQGFYLSPPLSLEYLIDLFSQRKQSTDINEESYCNFTESSQN
ncbi:putative bifunctional diguanylate cyclase/phosphodiesterase [Vibrio caribbeanicus]|uniref:C-di-GMP phosphodiesterase MbaA repressor of biofilm formation n=1 Tax=Vibrio caribbeanicus ATCC BAA-2122 TaxID=796620 RepID=E3BGA5_9VIBR|nr:EAL domain-containing protein [Vibrio caribbeanicus]EFP97918.1 C-di-GMP phosphodiesterase MbaA repressor of biofilm formation [Vibrio caribbeanicus ATCC BAA-2122]